MRALHFCYSALNAPDLAQNRSNSGKALINYGELWQALEHGR
jgi:hypothetical protein